MTHAGHRHHDWDDAAGWAKEIRREPGLAPVTEALLDTVQLQPGDRLLDLACGLGQTTAAAATRGLDALGVDLSENRIAAARERFPHATFRVADASSPPTGPWDAAVCRFGAHHLPPGWADAVLDVLAPGGRFAIAEWPPHDEQDRENGMRPTAHWVQRLERAGFHDVRVDTPLTLPSDEIEPARHNVFIISGRKPDA